MRQPALSPADETIRGAGSLALYSIDDASELLVVAACAFSAKAAAT
jgi:hypothetical protein